MALQATPPPPAKGMSAQQYYITLVRQGYPNATAMQMVQQSYGPPKTPQQRKEEAEKKGTTGQIAAGVGMVGGAIATRYIMDNAGQYWDKLTGNKVTEEVVKNAAQQGGETIAQTGATAAQAGGSGLPNVNTDLGYSAPDFQLDASGAGGSPQVISSEGGMSTVQTPAGVQQVPTESLNDPSFWSSVDWAQVAQGGLALAQMYGAYQAYKSGDKVGAGITGAAAAGNLAAASGAASGAYVVPGLNIVAGAYGGYQTAEAMSDMAKGSKRTRTGVVGGASSGAAIGGAVGSIVPGVGTAIGAGVGAVVGAIAGAAGSYFGSSKGAGQMQRDAVRNVLQKNGIIDENWQGTLADGSKTDFGQDGSKLNTKAMTRLSEEQPEAYNAAKQLGDAIAASYGFVGTKASSLARMYVRGALANANNDPKIAIANMQHFAKQQGINFGQLKNSLDEAKTDNRISDAQYNALLSSGQQLTGEAPAAAREVRPEKGTVNRLSAGVYRDDRGRLVQAPTMRQALEMAYTKTQPKEKKNG